MKFKTFLHKLFPCMKEKEQQQIVPDTNTTPDSQKQFFEEQLSKERQKRLEEIRQQQLENERLENERLDTERLERENREKEQLALEEFETILREAKERAQREDEERTQREDEERTQREAEEREAEEREAEERAQKESEERAQRESEEVIKQNKKKIVHTIFTQYKEQYHEFYSTRLQPIHSNFNEKMFKNLCNKFEFTSEEELLRHLSDYNLTQKQNKKAYNQLSTKRKLKCDVFNFYLFIDCGHAESN